MKRSLKIIIFFSLLGSIQALSYERDLKPNPFNSFYGSVDSFHLKDLGFLKKDSAYYVSPLAPRAYLIMSEEFTGFLDQWSEYKKRIDHHLSGAFERSPYFRNNYLFFSSPRWQIANATATVHPLPFVHIYPSGSTYFMDNLSLFSWPQDTLLHEMSHIYQMSQNTKLDRILWPFVPSLFFTFLPSPDLLNSLGFFISALSYRNMLLPSWILEGDAILIESLYGSGGRLFSGFVRAFVFSQIQEFSLKRLLKPYDDSFAYLEKYLHGAYFFSYLHSQYGLEKIKKLFYESGRFVPLGFYGLNHALKRTFRKDLITLFEEYKLYYKDLAQKHKVSSAPALAKSKAYVPLNSDEKSVYFLISDSKSPSELIVFDKKTGAVTKSQKKLPIGKVFYREGKYYSSASIKTSSSSREYSLIKEDFKPIKKYNSQNVMDFYKDKAIAIDARQSHIGSSLIIDKVFYNTVDSSVLADLKGNLYYFKQEAEYRTLYQNKTPLVQFKSYFSYPVEVNTKEVYFIGATKYGSSLFVYKRGLGIYRLSASEAIVSARKLEGKRFLISEITPTHYEYKVIETQERLEQPVLYQYSFQKQNIFIPLEKPLKKDLREESFNQHKALTDRENVLEKDFSPKSFKPYNSLSMLSLNRFAFFYLPVLIEEKETEGELDHSLFSLFHFLDPLQFNELLISNFLSKTNKFINAFYSYKKYRPAFEFSVFYDERRLSLEKDEYLIETYKELGFLETEDIYLSQGPFYLKRDSYFQRTWDATLSVSYPFYISSESSLIFKAQFGGGKKEFNKSKVWKDYLSQSSQLAYQFKRKYSQAYSYHKKRDLSLKYEFLGLKNNNRFLNGTGQFGFIEELGREYFLSFRGKAFINLFNREPKNIQVKEGLVFYCSDLKLAGQNLSEKKYPCPNEDKLSLKSLYQGSLEMLKVLNYSYYPLKAPFSLRRLAPLAGLSFFSAQDFNESYRSFFIPFVALEADISFLHEKLIVKLGLSLENRIEVSKDYRDSKFQLSFWLKSGL